MKTPSMRQMIDEGYIGVADVLPDEIVEMIERGGEQMTREERRLSPGHQPMNLPHRPCASCSQPWPCDYSILAPRLAAVEGELEQANADLDEASAMLDLKNEMAFRSDTSGVHAPSYRTVIDSQQREIVRLRAFVQAHHGLDVLCDLLDSPIAKSLAATPPPEGE